MFIKELTQVFAPDEAQGAGTAASAQGDAVEHVVSSAPALTPDQIKASKEYKDLLSESVARRQEIKRLEDELKKLAPPAQDASAQTPAPTAAATLNEETVNKIIAAELAKVQLKADQDALLKTYNVPVEDWETWRDANTENMTKRLQKAFGAISGGSASPGNGSGSADPYSDVRARVRARISGQGENPGINLYQPDTQRRLGGGIVTNG